MEELAFHIVRSQGENLSLTYRGPSVGNWSNFRLDAKLSPFRCSFDIDAHAEDVVLFAEQVRRLHESLAGTASFSNVELNVKADATINRLGHVTWKIELCPSYDKPTLVAEFVEDQSMLPPLLEELDAVIAALLRDRALYEVKAT